ncbi:D-alanyl-D-alanine carboxypeptidase family protein [Candidatus Uhrbacteria bacterium]|nr:D-alanyl-D-alanine carboxypeptidase family protein [Candidatus Uhrbacteria bacterium]
MRRLIVFSIFNLLLMVPATVHAVGSCATLQNALIEQWRAVCAVGLYEGSTLNSNFCDNITDPDRHLNMCRRDDVNRRCVARDSAIVSLCNYGRSQGICAGLCAQDITIPETVPPPGPTEPELAAEGVILPRLQIDIPTLQPFTRPRTYQEGEQVFLDIGFIGQYIVGLYQYLVGIVGILAGVIYTWAGFRWLTSGGDPEKIGDAKKKIAGATMGLVLVLGSYLVLYLVNPALTVFEPLRIEYVKRIPLETPEESDNSFDAAAATLCPGANEFQPVPRTATNLGLRTGKDLLIPEAGQKLLEAARIADERGYGLWVCSAGRTLQQQQALWDSALRQHGSEEVARRYVAQPRCGAPHLTGRTVDITLWTKDLAQPVTGDGCTRRNVSAANAAQTTAQQRVLQEIMFTAGWRRYCGEWWHFEFGTPRAQRAGSSPCAN